MRLFLTIMFLYVSVSTARAQNFFDGKFTQQVRTHIDEKGNKAEYTLYDFSRERKGKTMKAKYFAQDAYQQYVAWRADNRKQILLVTAGAFSDKDAEVAGAKPKPQGLCVDNGKIANRVVDNTMDAMVIIYNGGADQGGVAVVDMDVKPIKITYSTGDNNQGRDKQVRPRDNPRDRLEFLSWGEKEGLTLFQTQLIYSQDRPDMNRFPPELTYGARRERRFLAICKKDGQTHHVIVDAPTPLQVNLSASYVKDVLIKENFDVMYIMNLDTGAHNYLHVYNGQKLVDTNPWQKLTDKNNVTQPYLEGATNLLIYYTE